MARTTKTLRRAAALPILVALTSCAVSKIAEWKPYVDTTDVQPGATRTLIEEKLGRPAHEWDQQTGVHCASYEFVAGRLGSRSDASAFAAMDVASLGLFEAVEAANKDKVISNNDAWIRRYVQRVVVTYRGDGTALGIFDNYAMLPENGVSGPRQWTHP